jgi:hypothetical protein
VKKDYFVASEKGIACHASEKEETADVEPGRVENGEGRRYARLTTFCTRDTTWPSDFHPTTATSVKMNFPGLE